MGEGKGSTLVHLLVVILSLVAFGFAIAAERRRSIGTLHNDQTSNATCAFIARMLRLDMGNMPCCSAKKNAYHTKYRDIIYAHDFSCKALRKGVFIAGAVFVVATMILNVYYYIYFTKATTQAAQKTNCANSTVGMTGYP